MASKKKSPEVIGTLHGMPWLKKDSPTHSRAPLAAGPDGEVLSMKKTNEDYFPGTREEKKVKKKKAKKGKTVWTLDTLEELMSPAVSPEEEEPNPCSNSVDIDKNSSQTNVAGAAVWAKEESTADKLFPNVQSIVIDRNEEAEMLTEALVESIATLQLESFRKPMILEKNQWEAAPDEDEGGWENVRRNLPSPLKHEPPSSNDEDNTSPRPGILRNKRNSFNRCLVEPESFDFEFKKLSESLKEEIKAGRSLKSVSFSETLLPEDPSATSSRNDESEKIVDGGTAREPNIDKYGRVDGYSERRLFMGKGARMKELQYIQSKNNVAIQDNKQPESEASVAMQPLQDVLKLERRPTTAVEEPPNSVDNPEKPFTEVETPTTVLDNCETENPQKLTNEIENRPLEKTEQSTAETEIPRLEEIEQQISEVEQPEKLDVTTEIENPSKEPEKVEIVLEIEQAEKPHDLMAGMENQETQQPETATMPKNDAILATMEILATPPPVQDVREPEAEPMTVVETPSTTEPEISTIEVELPEKRITGPESKEPAPTSVQEICQLTGMPMTRVETSENQNHPEKGSDLDVDLIIRPGVQDVRYMKKDPTIVVEERNRRKSTMRLWWLEPRKEEKSNKLKTRVENQPEESRGLKDLDNNRNSIKRPDKLKIEAPLWSHSKESSVSLQPKITAPETTESKEKNLKTQHETAREEPATRFHIVINNRRVEMVSCGTQTATETSSRDSQEKNLPSQNLSEKKSDSVGRCLVPTLVMDDTLEEDSTLDLETLVAIDTMPEPQFQSAAWQNLLVTGAALQGASYEAQNPYTNAPYLQNQNNFVPNSVPLNSLTPYQPFNAGMPIPIPSYSPLLSNYPNGNPPFSQTGCGYMLVSVGNPPYNNVDQWKPVERREDFLERENNNHATCRPKSEYERQAAGGVASGIIKSSQLPPAFTKKARKPDNDDRGIDSSESNLKNVRSTKDEVHKEEDSPSQATDDRRGPRKQKTRKSSRRNSTRDVSESETGSEPREKEKEPFSQAMWHQRKLAELRYRQNYGSLKDTTREKSSTLEENVKENSSNNNYLTESGNLQVDQQVNSPHSQMPVVYQIPNQQSPGIGSTTNWQYHANVMNPAQIPVNMIPGYQLIPNPHILASGSYNPMMYQQLQSQLFNQIQTAQNTASNVFSQNGFPTINNHSTEMVQAGIPRSQEYSAAGSDDSNKISTKAVRKPAIGRGRRRLT